VQDIVFEFEFGFHRLICVAGFKVWSFCSHVDKNVCVEDTIKSINLETFSP
jgi:hypothetical protein